MIPTKSRTLRSKALRHALFLHADGRCQICNVRLRADFHCDHIIPWRLCRRTNPHEMQALCPPCNLRKGGDLVKNDGVEVKNEA